MNEDRKHRSSTEDRPDTPAKAADAAEEVLQVFMLRAIGRSGQLRDVRAVRGWLSQILASSIADYWPAGIIQVSGATKMIRPNRMEYAVGNRAAMPFPSGVLVDDVSDISSPPSSM
ncbi:hypothetical protein RV134_210184 [Roseovarius sp. EC-HK134]|jgi:hypothetical protein|nr:hypothetical protein RV134_210184 [Roseovarius sp. EC-HK134]VVT01743.1 hypothetical protein RV420_260049 [Roseovarius sp. EC-SD190]|tara:strand:+ start:569 stop:916 length:348 start_codon:yes stop_codon:yes gene_type:complete